MFVLGFLFLLGLLAFKIFVMGIKAAWSIAKILCIALIIPAFLFGIFCLGFVYIAIPALIIFGFLTLFGMIR